MTETVVITGGGSGIGRAIALRVARAGRFVAVLDRDLTRAREVARECEAAGSSRTLALGGDVSREEDVFGAFERASAELGSVDGVVANAGIELNGHVAELGVDTWQRVIDTNLTGTFLTVQAAARLMRSAGRGGAIVCVSSPSAFVGFAGGGNAAYGASKGGVSALVRAAALDLATDGIRVNGLVPGATDTPMLYFGLEGVEREAERRRLQKLAEVQIPLARMAEPGEVADAAFWLLSRESSYVTGSHLVCDGGLMAKSANDF
ncbi:SDR family oxidoreductase [Leifsonia sp. ZF2019]|uniref:SDR family NAD(P)-dependent oxidoreductase n=1 Tax=Leifsonia sp. ZF2019 TaxID=2781978 RepID=UPI001CBE8167|nr:SDR family NAD(P)-dependent oxidoreductase [Leifsonia sp. ZF2019]UAJ78835.1 SDR family oxidoreductase [Leifsonia sp. ZF2019]